MLDSNSPSNLLSQETETNDEDEEEYLQIQFVKEMSDYELVTLTSQSAISEWIERVRFDSIQWILNTRTLLGFHPQTAYLSVTYFDRFLSMRMIDNDKHWAVRLLSVACLAIAAKMVEERVPALLEFRLEEYEFEDKVIERMELLVLTTLEWRMVLVTPFHYLHYFVSKLCPNSSQSKVVSRASDIILDITKDQSLVRHRPASIAVAAILVAMDLQLTRQSLETKMNASSMIRFLELEDVHSCYSGLLGKMTLPITSPEFSPGGRINVLERAPSAVGTKRKSLTFSDNDQDYSLPQEKRHRHC